MTTEYVYNQHQSPEWREALRQCRDILTAANNLITAKEAV